MSFSRRAFCQLAVAGFWMPGFALAEEVIDLEWADLVPGDDNSGSNPLVGLLPHDEGAAAAAQQMSTGVKTDWNGAIVRLSGFILPLDYDGAGVTAFLLVPYVGACIHVPPPPANQLVLVSVEKPYENKGLFEPVTVTGMFGTASVATQLAEVGYALSADSIVPY
jgi:hypothetical protein